MDLTIEEKNIVEKFLKDIEYFQYDFSYEEKFDTLFPKGGETNDEYKARKDYLYGLVAHKSRVIHMAYTPGFPPNTRYTISEKGELVRDFIGGYAQWEKFNEERINYIRNYRQHELDHFKGEKSNRCWSIVNIIASVFLTLISVGFIGFTYFMQKRQAEQESTSSQKLQEQIQNITKELHELRLSNHVKIQLTDTVSVRQVLHRP